MLEQTGPDISRRVAFAAGIASLLIAWLAPFPHFFRHSFSGHMTVHMTVVAIAAPLIALGLPSRRVMSPLIASLIELAAVWLWHMPALHHAARGSTAAFVAEQGTFLLAGLLLWMAVFGGRGRDGEGVVALLLTAMHMTLLGALLAMSPRPLYAHASSLDDQHLGGAIMILVGGFSYLAGGLWLSAKLLRRTPST